MTDFPVYETQGEQIIARAGDHIIASGNEFSKVAESAEEYFNALRDEKAKTARTKATHIITPNGQKATVLGRTASIWDDEITVRFDNGEIRRFSTSTLGDKFSYVETNEEPEISKVASLQNQLDKDYDPTKRGLVARLNDLEEIKHTVKNLIVASKSVSEQGDLHKIAMVAENEKFEIKEALAHLTSVDEAIEMPKLAYTAVEQVSLGRSDNWLEVVASEMAEESANQDFNKLLGEGPTLLVSSLDDNAIQDAGTVREVAINHIHSKTAGFQGENIEDFRTQFVAAAEVARRREASYRAEVVKEAFVQKEASIEGASDEGLFL